MRAAKRASGLRMHRTQGGAHSRKVTEIGSLVHHPLGGSNHFQRLGSLADGLADRLPT
jgi:hypothetical protein